MKATFFKFSFFITFCVIEYLALTPQHIEVIEGLWDKQNHFIAFFVLYILLSLSTTQLSTLKKFGLLFLVGFQIEAMQYFIPGRFFSLMDIVADSIGILIGLGVYHYGLKRYFNHWLG
ncbi:MAG TPA: VanZ family protein [Sulfuricurvum sp.]|nr:VanZ family protein [Sulfuricurvum sp.]